MSMNQKISSLPSSPGVYLMKDSIGTIIYVGKSKNLKQRVSSYFGSSSAHSPKVKRLVMNIRDFDFISTDTEFEALLLEWQLIQDLKPHYNRQMKSPMRFVYLAIPKKGEFRRITLAQTPLDGQDFHCFGPYTNKAAVERAIQGLLEIFTLQCSSPMNRKSPCLNYGLGLCNGLCFSRKALKEYDRVVQNLILLLGRKDTRLLAEMDAKMEAAAENLDFEKAAAYRNTIKAVKALLKKEEMIGFTEKGNNLLLLEPVDGQFVKLFLIKRTAILFAKKIKADPEGLVQDIKASILEHFPVPGPSFPLEVSRYEVDKAQIIYSYLHTQGSRYLIVQESWLQSPGADSGFDQALSGLLANPKM